MCARVQVCADSVPFAHWIYCHLFPLFGFSQQIVNYLEVLSAHWWQRYEQLILGQLEHEVLTFFLSYLSSHTATLFWLIFDWARFWVSSQSGCSSSWREAGFPDLKCVEQTLTWSVLFSVKSALDIAARKLALRLVLSSNSCSPLLSGLLVFNKKTRLCHELCGRCETLAPLIDHVTVTHSGMGNWIKILLVFPVSKRIISITCRQYYWTRNVSLFFAMPCPAFLAVSLSRSI